MSVKAALAKLSATAAGGALVAGGAVHVAERPITDSPSYKSQSVKQIKAQPKPIKRATPKPPVRAAASSAVSSAAVRAAAASS